MWQHLTWTTLKCVIDISRNDVNPSNLASRQIPVLSSHSHSGYEQGTLLIERLQIPLRHGEEWIATVLGHSHGDVRYA